MANHDSPALCSRLSFGELLQTKDCAISQIRSVYSGLKWGKGLSAINHMAWELIEKVERENRLQNRPTLPILVVIGWAGNDVHGDFGYQGCTWIHQTNLTKSDADRMVAADYVDKQYKKVQRSLEGLVEIEKDPRVLSVQVIGNGDHSVNHNDLTVLPNPGIMVKKGNHSQMAQEFRLGKYYNLPRSISYTMIIFQYTIIIHHNTLCFTNLLQYVSLYHYPTRWGFLWVLLYMFLYRAYHGFIFF